MRPLLLASVLSTLIFGTANVEAATVLNLTIDQCSGGCNDGTQPFGTVTLTPNGTSVNVAVQLNDSYQFQRSTGLEALVFSDTSPTATVTNLSSGFSVDSGGPFHQDGFGDFLDSISKAVTGGQLLDFTLTNTTLADFALSTGNGAIQTLFSADIVSPNGHTGPIGQSGQLSSPIPGAVWLMAVPLVLLLGFGRKSKPAGHRLALS
jgi:hypothetical protein